MRMMVVRIGSVGVGVVVVMMLAQPRRRVTRAPMVGLVQVVVVILLGVVHVGVLRWLGGRQVAGRRQVRPLCEGQSGDRDASGQEAGPQDPHPHPHLQKH